jgi:hypothetical protein
VELGLSLRKERRLGVSENRVLRGIFGPKKGRRWWWWWEAGGELIMRSFMTCTFHKMLLG